MAVVGPKISRDRVEAERGVYRVYIYIWVVGCQNYGPFLGRYPKYQVPYYNKDPQRDQNFDNHPYMQV